MPMRAQDGINQLSGDVVLEIPHEFTYCLGSAQFGPFAKIPALAAAKTGQLNVMAMPRSSGATTFAKLRGFKRNLDRSGPQIPSDVSSYALV